MRSFNVSIAKGIRYSHSAFYEQFIIVFLSCFSLECCYSWQWSAEFSFYYLLLIIYLVGERYSFDSARNVET